MTLSLTARLTSEAVVLKALLDSECLITVPFFALLGIRTPKVHLLVTLLIDATCFSKRAALALRFCASSSMKAVRWASARALASSITRALACTASARRRVSSLPADWATLRRPMLARYASSRTRICAAISASLVACRALSSGKPRSPRTRRASCAFRWFVLSPSLASSSARSSTVCFAWSAAFSCWSCAH